MAKKHSMLCDIPEFSIHGEFVYESIVNLQKDNPRIQLLAKRFARAVTRFDSGIQEESGPLDQFMLFGNMFSPMRLLVKTLAELWTGKPLDNSSPFTLVDCSTYKNPFPGTLVPLTGSYTQDQNMWYHNRGILEFIEMPNFKARSTDLKLLQDWAIYFKNRFARKIRERGADFYRRFNVLLEQSRLTLYTKEIDMRGPFKSIIFFDRINEASPPLQELVMHILTNGLLILPTGTHVDFSNSIVMLSMYEEDVYGNKVGFITDTAKRENSYTDTRQKLRRISPAFIQAIAENLIIIDEQDYQSQKKRVITELERTVAYFKNVGISISLSNDFIEGFIGDTKESDTERSRTVYTEERIASGIKRHIKDTISRLIAHKKLKKNSSLHFDAETRALGEEFSVAVTTSSGKETESEEALITPDDVRNKGNSISKTQSGWPQWLLELDEKAQTLL